MVLYWLTFLGLPYVCTKHLHVSIDADEEQIKYYKDLINNGTEASLNWIYPIRNTYFEGYDTLTSIYYGTFDFIIVGGGSAGAVLARRLTDVYSWKVLLLEAGGDETDFSVIPKMFLQNLRSERNWGYRTVPQAVGCRGAVGHRCDFPRGKTLGGSSGNNAMFFVRGNIKDFNDWTNATKSNMWSYENVRPYFKKSETSEIPNSNPKYRGFDGPLHCTHSVPLPHIAKEIIAAHVELGLDEIDYNGEQQIGVAELQSSIKSGRRHSSNRAYLQPVLQQRRKQLVVLRHALATKVLFKKNNATGVQFLYKGKTYHALPKKEIILSAGAINTPQLLMLSGVGPRRDLEAFKIPVVADLPVGRNLEDHPQVLLPVTTNVTKIEYDTDKLVREYLEGAGYLTSMEMRTLSYFAKDKESGIPDCELLFTAPGPFLNPTLIMKNYNMNLDVFLETFPLIPDYIMGAGLVLLHSKSRGTIKLNSIDPLEFPLVDPNYFTDPNNDDIETLFEAVKFLQELFTTEAAKRINASIYEPKISECQKLKNQNDSESNIRNYWYCIFKYLVTTIYHPIATCKMGTDPKLSVVNQYMEIHGLNGIRVVDAGVIPSSTSGHPNVVVIMLAERMSEIISQKYTNEKAK